MTGDPLSDILQLARARPTVSGGFCAGGRWALRFPQPEHLKFFALVKGWCWLCLEGAEPIRVEEGDVFLLSVSSSFVLAGDLATEPQDALALFAGQESRHATLGDGADCVQIGGHVRLDAPHAELVAEVLPPLIHVRAGSTPAPVLQWLLDQLVREREAELPGSSLVSAQIAQMMFIQILRVYLETCAPLPCGWLRAVSDRRLSPAMRLMHAEPGRNWTLAELARAAAMSRTSFAVHFKAVAGVGALTYLGEWRMLLAQRDLRDEDTPLAVLAARLGYSSESAFSNAFKRSAGLSPARYRSRARAEQTKKPADAGF